MIRQIRGGVCAPQGFTASGIHCGIRKGKDKRDLALILSDRQASAAGVYTQNLVKGAPIIVTQNNLKDGKAQAAICNSGNANTCNANGMEIAEQMCALVAQHTGVLSTDVIVASTGVIGQQMSIAPIAAGMPMLVAALSTDDTPAAQAIMTTDTIMKQIAVEFDCGGATCKLGGIAKGSGMIHPNMATMLVFLTTDAAIAPGLLQKALREDAENSFNMVSVDGDTSTNDTLTLMANGAAGGKLIDAEDTDYAVFKEALHWVTTGLCRMIAKDGEGATKLITCEVSGAPSSEIAKKCAKSVICSSLVKAAMFGADANWGRVLCALGYAGADIDVSKVDVSFHSDAGAVDVCRSGAGIPFGEQTAKNVLLAGEILIAVGLNSGTVKATAWGCDLTYDYVKINGDYRT